MRKQIKQSLTYISLSTLLLSIPSCTNSNSNNRDTNRDATHTEDSKDRAEDHNDAKFDDSKEKDAQFLVDAASINLQEIRLSQLAETKASANDVKDLAKMMVTEHTKSLNELKTLAAQKSVSIPNSLTNDGLDDYNKLMEVTNNNFDKKYCDMMVDAHKNAIKKFEKIADDTDDPEIKEWSTKTLPTLRNHLDHAMTCSEKYK
jgi:putative membrane protein